MFCRFISRRGSQMFHADVAAVTLSSQFSTPIIIPLCVKNPVMGVSCVYNFAPICLLVFWACI